MLDVESEYIGEKRFGSINIPNRTRGFSICFLSSFCISLTHHFLFLPSGLEIQDKGPNYYSQLGVTRTSSPLEIKRAYKTLSLKLHPDKNPSPDASSQFEAIKQAYDVLMDMELRDVYNKFGKEGINSSKRYSEQQFLLECGIYYVSMGMLVFFLTMGRKSNGDSRNWCFTGLIAMLVLEVAMMTQDSSKSSSSTLTTLLPTVTEYEIIWILHSLYPAFMNGCRTLGAYLYVDVEAQGRQLLLALSEQNKDILLVLRELQIGMNNLQAHGGSVRSGSTNSSTAGMAAASDNNNNNKLLGSATPTGKLRELQQRLHTSDVRVAQAVQNLQNESAGGGGSNMGFYLMILGYILISYMFG